VNNALVTDTHPLLHYFFNRGKKLSRKAKQAFIDATENKNQIIYVPAVVLWEISMLVEDGTIGLKIPLQDWINALFKNYPTILSQPFNEITVIQYHENDLGTDPFDRAIVASALQLGLPLITNDSIIHSKKPCALYWD
jgi:PIN domain nuclease of toxin-antitoxin system